MLARVPLLSFALMGGLGFFLLSPVLPFGKHVIRVDARTREQVVEQRAAALGRELSSEERQQALDAYVDDEMLLEEARRRGRHRELMRVRQRLVLAMRTALDEEVPSPSDAQLRAYFNAHRQDYSLPATVTWSHVFFAEGSAESSDEMDEAMSALSGGADFRTMGDAFSSGSVIERATHARMVLELGERFADELFAVRRSGWHGPLVSTLGRHIVRVESRVPETTPELSEVRRYVELDWRTGQARAIFERKLARIRQRYDIRVSP